MKTTLTRDHYSLRMVFPIKAVPKGRPRFTKKGHAFTPPQTRQFESELKWLASTHKDRPKTPFMGPLMLRLEFKMRKPPSAKRTHPDVKPDVGNLAKSVEDAMNGILWKDDCQIVSLEAHKTYSEDGTDSIHLWLYPVVL